MKDNKVGVEQIIRNHLVTIGVLENFKKELFSELKSLIQVASSEEQK